jgi:hypothetical protein
MANLCRQGLEQAETTLMIPFERDEDFVGREDIIMKTDEAFSKSKSLHRLALEGLGTARPSLGSAIIGRIRTINRHWSLRGDASQHLRFARYNGYIHFDTDEKTYEKIGHYGCSFARPILNLEAALSGASTSWSQQNSAKAASFDSEEADFEKSQFQIWQSCFWIQRKLFELLDNPPWHSLG